MRVPDGKEGIYFGTDLADDHPLVRAGTPLHGANLFPTRPPELRTSVIAYLDVMTELCALLPQAYSLEIRPVVQIEGFESG